MHRRDTVSRDSGSRRTVRTQDLRKAPQLLSCGAACNIKSTHRITATRNDTAAEFYEQIDGSYQDTLRSFKPSGGRWLTASSSRTLPTRALCAAVAARPSRPQAGRARSAPPTPSAWVSRQNLRFDALYRAASALTEHLRGGQPLTEPRSSSTRPRPSMSAL
ncbi:MAG: hypothetical protein ACLR4Z_14805 [Butyricicoccaceae bacterium]